MPRLPFAEPDPPPGPKPAKAAAAPPMTVAELCARLKGALADAFPTKVRVVGEVSNFSGGRSGSTSGVGGGHWFFSLKDAEATIRCVAFASVTQRIKFPVANGLEVVATGRLDLYPAQGHVQLYIDRLEPVGQGALELALRELMEELREAGYFEPMIKQAPPLVPRRVAVVTSRSAAALQDVINTAGKRWPGCELLLYDVRVQGADAAPQIAAALRNLAAQGQRLGIDAIILTRGGGSIEDLWAFNERIVADAIFECPIPVVAAIGHETDTTIAELVADLRCATPTQAAMAVVPDRASLSHQVEQNHDRLRLLVQRQLQHARQQLNGLTRQPCIARPITLLENARQRLESASRHPLLSRPERLLESPRLELTRLDTRLRMLPGQQHTRAMQKLDQLAKHLDAVGPRQVLARGFTYTLDAQGRPVTRAGGVGSGDRLTTVFADGKVHSTADGKAPADRPDPKPVPRRRITRPKPSADAGGLFDLAP